MSSLPPDRTPRLRLARLLAALGFGLAAAFPAAATALDVTLSLDDGDALVSRSECIDRSSEEVSLDWDLESAAGDSVEILASSRTRGWAWSATTGG